MMRIFLVCLALCSAQACSLDLDPGVKATDSNLIKTPAFGFSYSTDDSSSNGIRLEPPGECTPITKDQMVQTYDLGRRKGLSKLKGKSATRTLLEIHPKNRSGFEYHYFDSDRERCNQMHARCKDDPMCLMILQNPREW
jgi:hypothetical protein